MPALNVTAYGVTSAARVTVQLVPVPEPNTAKLKSVQATSAEPFHQFAVLASQVPLPSCAPANELLASHAFVTAGCTVTTTLFNAESTEAPES